MTWKYALRECKMHVVMSVLCLVQAVLLFAMVIGLLSIFMKRYSLYEPVQKLMEQKGFICNLEESIIQEKPAEGRPVQSSQCYEKMLKDAHVYGQYSVDAFVDEPQDVARRRQDGEAFDNVRAYDDGWIQEFVPKMQSGKWLRQKNTQGKYLEAVVLQSTNKYKTGDVAYIDTGFLTELKTKIPVKIVGIINKNSNIIYQSNYRKQMDYHILFSNMVKEVGRLEDISYTDNKTNYKPATFFVTKKNLDRVQEQYEKQEAPKNLTDNYDSTLHCKKAIFTTNLDGVVLITMNKNSSRRLLAYNKNKIAQISRFDFLHDLSYIKKNTWHGIMAGIWDLIPVGVGMIVFTIISFITLSTLMYQKNMRKYSVYYMNGLTWKDIFRIHMTYILLLIIVALALGTVLISAAGYCGLWNGLAVQIGVVQIGGCVVIMAILLLTASLMCVSFAKGKSAKRILQEVEG